MGNEENSSNSPIHHQSKKNEIQTQITEEIPNLPEEIIIEILARLPVKCLLKFRCVSKSWLSVISSSQFIEFHLSVSKKDPTFANHRIMFTSLYAHVTVKQFAVTSVVMNEPLVDIFDFNYPKESPDRVVRVVGSCNGLICIAVSQKQLLLWNPATRVSTKVPPMNVEQKPGFYDLYGFGYNECGDDYIVVGILVSYRNKGESKNVKMYSLKSNSWKTIKDFQGDVLYDDAGLYASGKLHFSTGPEFGHDLGWDINSIDLSTEEYGIIEQPSYGEGDFFSILGVLEGRLCVISSDKNICTDVWVLKEYGVKESWTKMATIFITDYPKRLFLRPLLIMPDGQVLLVLGSHLVVYNLKDNSLRRPEMSNLRMFQWANIYVESLVSPSVGRN